MEFSLSWDNSFLDNKLVSAEQTFLGWRNRKQPVIVPSIAGERMCGKVENRNACISKRKKMHASKEIKQSGKEMFEGRSNNPVGKLPYVLHLEVSGIWDQPPKMPKIITTDRERQESRKRQYTVARANVWWQTLKDILGTRCSVWLKYW